MKAKRLRDVRDFIQSEVFTSWFMKFSGLRRELTTLRERAADLQVQARMLAFRVEYLQQLGDDTVMQAGESEEWALQSEAEFGQIENDSFQALSSFETKRQEASDRWAALGGAEKALEDLRQRLGEARAKLESKSTQAQERERLQGEVKSLEAHIVDAGRTAQEARKQLEEAESTRDRIWLSVEETWSDAFRARMASAEYTYQSRRVRREAEQLFTRVHNEKQRIDEVNEEARRAEQRLQDVESSLQELLDEARESFDGVLVSEFMYWPIEDDVQAAFCVPLIDERNLLNIQVNALQVYRVGRERGLSLIEPVAQDVDSSDDPRLGAFFSEGRPGL
ncbi:MAG: hypothetical protein R3C68_16050 [Myxococcota bacterium]